jgi:hypothetical protein
VWEKALEITPPLAVIEAAFLVLWSLRTWFIVRKDPGSEPFDDGPWWSVWFFRLWAVCHLPVLLLQAGIFWLVRKNTIAVRIPFVVAGFLIHAINLALVVVVLALEMT